jgi:PRTRC genetic system protein A
MTLQVVLPHFSCIVSSDEALKQAEEEGYCEIFIISQTGLFKRTGLTHGRSVTVPCAALPGNVSLPKSGQDVSKFFPAGKIPKHFLAKIISFFKAVMVENKGTNLEAQAFVIWNPELGYHIRIPEQTVAGASVSYSWENFLGPNDVVVLDMHSHNNMNAFFSGTDDRDDNGNCTISGVVGKLSTTCELVFRFNLPGNLKINPLGMDFIFAEEEDNFEVPKDWLNNVKRQVYVPPVVPVGGYNYGGNGYNKRNYGKNATAGGVVHNESFRGQNGQMAMDDAGLSQDDAEVLASFGHPFPFSGEGGNQPPFTERPLTKGRKTQKQASKVTRLKTKARSPRIII